jgi:hypothetical protein
MYIRRQYAKDEREDGKPEFHHSSQSEWRLKWPGNLGEPTRYGQESGEHILGKQPRIVVA